MINDFLFCLFNEANVRVKKRERFIMPINICRRYFMIIIVLLCAFTFSAFGQTLDVTIVERFTTETGYSNYAPGYSYVSINNTTSKTRSNTNVYATDLPARQISYSVTGATFALLLPDGRVAVVNCASKSALKFDYVNRRSCRMPIANEIKAEFKKDNAKLRWVVSIDGRKTESETYKILGVLGKDEWTELTGIIP